MNITGVIIAAVVVGATGIIIGILLGLASEKFKVNIDEKEVMVRNALPGNNCGACGYPGCDGLAKAIASGAAPVGQCPVGGAIVADIIGSIMGVKAVPGEKKVAFVKCKGSCDKTQMQYRYFGISDCRKISIVPGAGEKACDYGCIGYGSCFKACKFDAIHIVDGVSLVDKDKCVACGACITTCPKNLIEFVPYASEHLVQCSSQDKGKDVKAVCDVGCIGCTLCTKVCEFDAIHMIGNVAKIDYTKCTNCGKCAEKCPVKVII